MALAGTKHKQLPGYEPLLDAYHHAFSDDLESIIHALPIRNGDHLLDMACGDGFYTTLLAGRVSPRGSVIAVDIDSNYLKLARTHASRTPFKSRIQFIKAAIQRLPFSDALFDAAWCAQSLYSLPDPRVALMELRRVVRPNGIVAILENDLLHHVLLPWPPGFEMRIRQAEYQALKKWETHPSKFYLPRRISTLFSDAGLIPDRKRIYAHTRHAPLSQATRTFLDFYLATLKRDADPFLSREDKKMANRLLNPKSDEYLLSDPFLTVTCLDTVLWGVRPPEET